MRCITVRQPGSAGGSSGAGVLSIVGFILSTMGKDLPVRLKLPAGAVLRSEVQKCTEFPVRSWPPF